MTSPKTPVLAPLAYGYLRTDLLGSADLAICEARLAEAARRLGCQLGCIFHEDSPQTSTVPPAYLDLVRECCRAEAHRVVTGCGHLCGMAIPRTSLLDVLAVRAQVQVCEVAL